MLERIIVMVMDSDVLCEGVGRLVLPDGVRWVGNIPFEKCVLLASFFVWSRGLARALFLSALEASIAGFDVIVLSDGGAVEPVIQGVEAGHGRLFLFSHDSFGRIFCRNPRFVSRLMRTGGGVISVYGSFQNAVELAVTASQLSIFAGRWGRGFSPVSIALDNNKDCFILRSGLLWESGRSAVRDGCPVIDSFSSVFSCPDVIGYEAENGRYRLNDKYGETRFEVVKL